MGSTHGNFTYYKNLFSPVTVVEDDATKNIPDDFVLYQNYPNPFNPNTIISYNLSTSGKISLKVYDILGKEVATLVDEEKPAGSYEIEFNASRLSSGVYFYTLRVNGTAYSKSMILMK